MLWCFVPILLVATAAKADDNCHLYGITVYEDLGCKPIKNKPDDVCPSKYNCDHFHEFNSHCYYQGQKYALNEQIPSNITDRSCNAGCICGEKGRITCAVLDCPSWLGVPTKHPDCYRTYDVNKCCSVGEICPPFDNVATCEVDGETYKEGQKFYPKGTCSVCVCHKGFVPGKFEAPHCRLLSCGTELNNRGDLEKHCAPVYQPNEHLCCPVFWACLSEDDVINSSDKPTESKKACVLGRKIIRGGDYLEKRIEKYGQEHIVHCSCKLPPLPTCVIKKSNSIR